MKCWSKLLGKSESKLGRQDSVEWIAVYFPLISGEYGSESEVAEIHTFTDHLQAMISESSKGVFDGDEFGEGQCGLFMYGPDADQLLAVILPFFASWNKAAGGQIILRYGDRHGREQRISL